jgi:hypothetical protein
MRESRWRRGIKLREMFSEWCFMITSKYYDKPTKTYCECEDCQYRADKFDYARLP